MHSLQGLFLSAPRERGPPLPRRPSRGRASQSQTARRIYDSQGHSSRKPSTRRAQLGRSEGEHVEEGEEAQEREEREEEEREAQAQQGTEPGPGGARGQ